MPIVFFLLAAAGVGYLMLGGTKPLLKATEASAEATGLFASMIAPSMVSIDTLRTSWTYLLTAAKNLETGGPAQSRLAQYAMVCFLKACMLAKGAQPNANELAALGAAPLEGGAGLISYGDVGLDQMTAVAAGLAGTYMDVGGLGQYIAAVAGLTGGTSIYPPASPGSKRLQAFLLALKAKQMLLANPVQFDSAAVFAAAFPQCLFAIANLPAAAVPASSANSILSYQ